MPFLGRLRSFLFKNTTDSQTVAKNTVWLSISNFGGRLLKAVVIIYAARALDPAGLGVFSYAVTLAGFLTFFVDPGLNVMLIREGNKKSGKEGEEHRMQMLSTTFYIKLALIAAAVLFVLLLGPYFSTLPGARALLPIVALIIIGDTLREFFSSFLWAKEKMEWGAIIFLLTNLAIVVLGCITLFLWPTALYFGWAYALGTTLGALFAAWVLRHYFAKLFSAFNPRLLTTIFYSAWPFAVTGTLGLLLTNTDILILSWLTNAADVGVYSAVVRIIQVLYLFPVILQYSTLPLLSRLARTDAKRFRETLEWIIAVIFSVSVPLAVGGVLLAAQIMHSVFGAAYVAGASSLMLLMLSTLVDYPGGVISLAVFAYDRQKVLVKASLIGGITNVVFDLLFIPHFGIVGSAMATLIAQILNNAYLWYAMKKINYFSVLPRLKKITLSALVMGLCTWALVFMHAELLLNIAASAAVYVGMLVFLGEPLLLQMTGILALEREKPIHKTADTAAGASAVIGAHTIPVEVAKGTQDIRTGLSGRESLRAGHAMLFVFPRPKRYRFWMRGMLFPLDIIWVQGSRVVGLTQNVPADFDAANPQFYRAPRPADYVLEANAGFVKEHAIRVGDRASFEHIAPCFAVVPAVEADRALWNSFLEKNHPPVGIFLETWEWGEFQKKLGLQVSRYIVKENDCLAAVFTLIRYPLPLNLSYGYLPRGPVIAQAYAEREAKYFEILQALKKWVKAEMPELAFLRMEPPLYEISSDIAQYGFTRPGYSVQPPFNTSVPLAAEEEDILARFHSSTRSNIKRAERRGVTFEMKKALTEEDYAHFFAMIQSTIQRNGGKKAYPSRAYLRTFLSTNRLLGPGDARDPAEFSLGFFCGYQYGKPAAVHIVVFFGDTATYLFGASYTEHLHSKVDTYLHWSAMQEAKRRGMRYYDLGGIDERIWPSLTAFKRQFGGEEFRYVGNIDVPLRPYLHGSYDFFKKTVKKMRDQA